MLTPDFKATIQAGGGPKASGGIPHNQPMSSGDFDKWIGGSTNTKTETTPVEKTPMTLDNNPVSNFGRKVLDAGADPIKEAATKVLQDIHGTDGSLKSGLSKGLDVAGDVAGGIVKSIGGVAKAAVIDPLVKLNSENPLVKAVANSDAGGKMLDAVDHGTKFLTDKWNQFSTDHPEAAKKIEDGGNIAQFMTLFVGDNPTLKNTVAEGTNKVSEVATDAKNAVVDTTKGAVDVAKGKVAEVQANRAAEQAANLAAETAKNEATKTSRAIDAINPDLTGKKLAGAYKEVVTGNRTAERSGIMGEQTLSPSQQAVNIGTRLRDVLSSKDPLENLSNLHNDLEATEKKLGPLLEKDVTTGTKDELATNLDALKAKVPREYRSIKENGEVFNNAIDFAKELVEQHPETTKGFREARSAFDAQAKKEFPSAFKEGGYIDTKMPAGRAIQLVRDTINDYNYSHASGGKAIQDLIQRESDIFKAADYISPKAAKLHGSSALQRFYKDHPVIGGVIKKGLNAVRLGETIHIAGGL